MRTLFKLITTPIIFFMVSMGCKAQTQTDYINFYNQLVPKLNMLANTKTQYYGLPFSQFKTALDNATINIDNVFYDRPYDEAGYYNTLIIYFDDWEDNHVAIESHYQIPIVYVEFEEHIPKTIEGMHKSYRGKWSPIYENFFSNYTIKEIRFVGLNGYNNPYRSYK